MGCVSSSIEQRIDSRLRPEGDVPSRSESSPNSRGMRVLVTRQPQLTQSRSNSKDKERIDWIPSQKRITNIGDILDVHEQLGIGSTCRVFRASWKRDDEEEPSTITAAPKSRAVKKLSRPRRTKVARREIEALCGLDHPNILRCEDAYADRNNIWMVMEYCSGGSLIDHLKEQTQNGLDEEYAKSLMRQLTDAVEHLHANGIVHRDIKPDNIVFADSTKTRIVLIDFGNARFLDSLPQLMKDWAGTPVFMSPEVFVERGREDLKGIDMWAVGVTCYVMVTGFFPFFGRDLKSVSREIARKKVAFPKGTKISRESRDFCCKLLLKNKFARMTAQAALNHTWIRED